jgi:excisionase family DNA binding protein
VPTEPEFLKVSEIARRLDVTPQSVREWIDKGLLPAVQLERGYRIRRTDLEAWLNRGRDQGSERSAASASTRGLWEQPAAAPTGVDGTATPGNDAERVRKDQASQRLEEAARVWASAIVAHQMAPPDPGFAGRLRALSEAARLEQAACEELHRAGLLWMPLAGAEGSQVPYELRPGTGRRGPEDLWVKFDGCVYQLNHAITASSAADVGAAFGAVADAAAELAEVVEAEDRAAGAKPAPAARRAG